jgi:superfamily I DNA/RNA helicase
VLTPADLSAAIAKARSRLLRSRQPIAPRRRERGQKRRSDRRLVALRESARMAIGVGAIALDDAQQSVALHGDGPMLVLAGPGTGKTRVGVERIVRLIERGLATPEQILFLAYNRKAAEEARRRLEMRLPGFPFERTILTFHSFALSLRNEFRQFAGLPAAALLTEDAERWELMEQALRQVAPSHLHLPSRPTTNVRTLLRLASRCRQELVTPTQLEEWARGQLADLPPGLERDEAALYVEAAQTIAAYEEVKTARGLIEFDDALVDTLTIVHDSAAIRDALRERYR